jgi:UDP-2-acetamido-2-deoxy-ribo-hexuluronate aminotransferase
VTQPSIPFIDLQAQDRRIKASVDARIAKVLASSRFILGPEVAELEAALSRLVGVAHAVGVSSGTDALRIPLMADNVGPGDAVFLPSFTYSATAEVPVTMGAAPVFIDVEPATYNLDPAALERAIARVKAEGRLRPRAVIAVDLFGLPADYPAIGEVCRRHDLLLIEDAAQSFGSRQGNRMVGALAPIAATSFYPGKPLGCYGDGGAIFTDDAERAALYKSIRFHGMGSHPYDVVRIGLNGRLDTIQAAVLLSKLEVFVDETRRRAAVAARYDAAFRGRVILPPTAEGTALAYYCILVDDRDKVAAALQRGGIPTMIYYPKPLHLQVAYEQYGAGPGSMPVSESLCGRILALPFHAYLEEAAQARIIDTLIGALARAA